MSEALSTAPVVSAMLPALPIVRIVRRGASSLAIKVAAAGIALVLQMALTRSLGFDAYGEFAFAFGWLQMALTFAQGGFSTAALRYVAEYRAHRQLPLLRGFIARATQIALAESIGLAFVMAAITLALGSRIPEQVARNLLVASLTLPVLSQLILHSTVIRGFGQALVSMLAGLVQPLLLVILLVVLMAFMPGAATSTRALLLNLGAALGALTLVSGVQRRCERQLDMSAACQYRTREWLTTATQMMFASALVYLHARTGVVVSGMLIDERAAGTYALVERLAESSCLGLTSVNLLVGPSFAALYSQGKLRELQRYARLAAVGSTAFSLAAVIPLVLFGEELLRLFGAEFAAGYPALLVLLAGTSVSAMCGSTVLLMSMTGHHALNTYVALASLLVNAGLSLWLIPRYGIIGTAWASAASGAVWGVSLAALARWKVGVWPNIGRLDSRRVI